MRKALAVLGITVVMVAVVVWALRAFGPESIWFAFFAVWAPMVCLGVVSRFLQPRLPWRYHTLRRFEWDGTVYERLGVRWFKRLLRRGPMARFNPDLHLPEERTPERLAYLDQRMRDAEASHAILFVLTLAIVVNAVARGWWAAAAATLLFDVLFNGYPVMLQRYNRAVLARRFGRPRQP